MYVWSVFILNSGLTTEHFAKVYFVHTNHVYIYIHTRIYYQHEYSIDKRRGLRDLGIPRTFIRYPQRLYTHLDLLLAPIYYYVCI